MDEWWTLGYVAKEHRINVRVGASHTQVVAMAAALSDGDEEVTPSVVYRTLLREALATRMAACVRSHQGPLRGGVCGHCGQRAG